MSTSQAQGEKAQEKRRQAWRTLLPAIVKAHGATLSASTHLERWGSKMYGKAMKLASEGIPTSIRGDIWKAVVGNPLRITPSLFEVFKVQAARAPDSLEGSHYQTAEGGRKIGKYASFSLISRDMFRTFDELKFLHDDPQWRSDLRNILECFVLYRPDIGYVQGMSYIACMIILNIPDNFQQFVCFANVILSPFCFHIFDIDGDHLLAHVDAFSLYVDKRLPALARHLKAQQVSMQMFLLKWLKTVFCQGVGIEVTVAIWDCFLLEGEPFLCRATLGLLRLREPELLQSRSLEQTMLLLAQKLPARFTAADVIRAAGGFSIDPAEFQAVLDGCIRQHGDQSPTPPRTPKAVRGGGGGEGSDGGRSPLRRAQPPGSPIPGSLSSYPAPSTPRPAAAATASVAGATEPPSAAAGTPASPSATPRTRMARTPPPPPPEEE